jgi:hypothetical protein
MAADGATLSELMSYAQVMDELRRACVEKKSGTMMLATADNQLARISLHDGEVVSINYRLKHGRDAIPLLKEIKQARVKFTHGKGGMDPAAGGTGALPPTSDIMRMLNAEGAAPAAAPAPTAGTVSTDQVPKALKVIESELIEVLGPLANIVWGEHLDKLGKPVLASKLRGFVDGLAKEIGDPTKVQAFKDKVWQKIGRPR